MIKDLVIDSNTYSLSDEIHSAELAKKEFELLFKLTSYPNIIFTKEQLLSDIWGLDSDSDENAIKTHISRIRSNTGKFEQFEIFTVRGLGYKLIMKKYFFSS